MFEIIPSPGTDMKDWHEMEGRLQLVMPFAKAIHIDVVDGIFAQNKTFADPKPFKKYTSNVLFEVHLMVDDPLAHLDRWADAGFRRFIGQVEKMSNQAEFVAKAQKLGEVGLAIDGPTSVEAIQVPFIDLDCVLVMAINAGFSGQKFIEILMAKVRSIRHQEALLPIEVDGGINDVTILEAKQAGAKRFVATSYIFKENPHEQYRKLQSALED